MASKLWNKEGRYYRKHILTFTAYSDIEDSLQQFCGFNLWNLFAVIYTSYDVSIWRVETTILDFTLPVLSHLIVLHCHYYHLIAGPRKHWCSLSNSVAYFVYELRSSIPSLESSPLVVQHCVYSHWTARPRKQRHSCFTRRKYFKRSCRYPRFLTII